MTSRKGGLFERLFPSKRQSKQLESIRVPEWFDYTVSEQNLTPAIRDLTSWLVEKYYPEESNFVDQIVDQLLIQHGARPLLATGGPEEVGLGHYGYIADLGSVKAFGFAAMLMLEVAAAAQARSKTIAEVVRELPRDQDAYEDLLHRTREELDLDPKSAHKFLDTALDLMDPHFDFVLGAAVPMEESRYCEFKMHESRDNVRAVGNDAYEYIAGFLNRGGGRIYFGITDKDRVVRGIALSGSERDELRQYVVSKTKSMKPPIYSDRYRINFHQIRDEQGNEIRDLFVVEIIVPFASDVSDLRTSGGRKVVRTESGIDHDRP